MPKLISMPIYTLSSRSVAPIICSLMLISNRYFAHILYAWLIFYTGSRPECRIQPSFETGTLFLGGSNGVTLSCEVRYRGRHPPHMHWNIWNGKEVSFNQTTVESNQSRPSMHISESSIRLTTKSEFLTQSPIMFTFTMFYFAWNSSDGNAGEIEENRNYSVYKHVWRSPNISTGSRKYHHSQQ